MPRASARRCPCASSARSMALRANVLAKGFSGIRVETLEALLAMLNRGVHPRVPSRGSVGASGDLAPLAHLALVLVGEGETLDQAPPTKGSPPRGAVEGPSPQEPDLETPALLRVPGAEALEAAGLKPITLEAKEGLALINGTQVSTAVLALALAGAERLSRAADISAALSIDALLGSMHPFEPRIHQARPFAGQAASADNLLRLLDGSGINASHANCGRVQDAYSMRCAPQVHGAAREALRWIRHIVTIEMNAATDNPMVFADSGEIVSGGNFHGAPLALAADLLVMAVAQLATISERRSERLVNPALSGLPAFLTQHGGLQSGLMIAQVTAAALTSEIKTLAHPASVDTIPTSANKEDHVSMSMHAVVEGGTCLAARDQRDCGGNLVFVPGHRLAGTARKLAGADARAQNGPRARRNNSLTTVRRRPISTRSRKLFAAANLSTRPASLSTDFGKIFFPLSV